MKPALALLLLCAASVHARAEDPAESETGQAEVEAGAPEAASPEAAAPAKPSPGEKQAAGFGPRAPSASGGGGASRPGFYDQKDVVKVDGAPDRVRDGVVPRFTAIPWVENNGKLLFPSNGTGYSIRFTPAAKKLGKTGPGAGGAWSWTITSDTRKGCNYMGLISSDAAGKKTVCKQGYAAMGNLTWTTGMGAECALKDGGAYWFHLYLGAAVGENPASMVAAGKTLCSAWLRNSGPAEYP